MPLVVQFILAAASVLERDTHVTSRTFRKHLAAYWRERGVDLAPTRSDLEHAAVWLAKNGFVR